jgi:hypothetical protein
MIGDDFIPLLLHLQINKVGIYLSVMRTIFCVLILTSVINPAILRAESTDAIPFYPTWKLLNASDKAQFMAGYLHGWADARNVTNIAIDFIKDNPGKAVNSLEDIRKLYDVSSLKPEALVEEVDSFYNKPGNKAASLSVAVTAAKQHLK